jgi:hypothetical protein
MLPAGELGESLWGVERRVEAVDSVLKYLDQKEASGDLSYEEFEVRRATGMCDKCDMRRARQRSV